MVKKKTRRKIVKPPQPKLDTVFNCFKCGQKKTVAVKFNRREKTAHLQCKSCKTDFETNIRPADAYIDIYYRWIDELEKERDKSSDEEEEEKGKKKEEEYEEEEAPDSESDKNKSQEEDEEEMKKGKKKEKMNKRKKMKKKKRILNKIETKEKENPEMKKVNNLLLNDSSIINFI